MKKITTILCTILCAICAISAQNQPTGVFMNLYAKDMAQPNAISENGKWAVGSAFWSGNEGTAGTINASKWNLETGERIYLVNDDDPSDAFCINNEGTVVGGSYLGQPAYWLESDGLWHTFSEYPRGYKDENGNIIATGDVMSMAFVDGDTIMIGYAFKSQTEGQIIRWVNGKLDRNFKYRKHNRYSEYLDTTINAEMEKIRAMSTDGKSYLISLDYNLLPVAGSYNMPTTYIMNEDTTIILERQFGQYDEVSFIEDAAMSHNGKFVCGRIHGVPMDGIDAVESAVAFTYDVENDIFDYCTTIESTGRYAGASCIDNQGHTYYKSINGNDPLGKPYIYKDKKFIELEACLLAYEGITAEQIDAMITDEVEGTDEDDLGIVWAVSGDGKTLIGAGGALKGNIWCAKLSCSPYDVDPVVAVENVTYDNLAAYYANGAITIKGNAEMIEVYSITGAKVMSQVVENSTIKADLNNGIYVVKVYNGNNVATSKVIVK